MKKNQSRSELWSEWVNLKIWKEWRRIGDGRWGADDFL